MEGVEPGEEFEPYPRDDAACACAGVEAHDQEHPPGIARGGVAPSCHRVDHDLDREPGCTPFVSELLVGNFPIGAEKSSN